MLLLDFTDIGSKVLLANSKTKKSETISKCKEDHVIDMTSALPPQPSPRERVIVKPIGVPPTTSRRTLKTINSAKFFSIASLQEYTDSFSQENLVGSGMLATVYKAELPNGKVNFIKH